MIYTYVKINMQPRHQKSCTKWHGEKSSIYSYMNLAGHKTIVPTLLKKMFVYISGRVYNKIFTVLSEEITSYFFTKTA